VSQHSRYLVALAVEAVIVAGLIAGVVAIVVTRRRERAQARAFRAERRARQAAILAALPPGFDYPTAPAPATQPVEHVGATEAYGPELRAAGQALPSADLRTTGEQMVADHRELGGIGDALDQFAERTMHELRLFCGDDLELFMQLTRWGGAALDDTNTFNRRDLDLALAGSVTR
jgi:hypothetical protein